MIKAKHTLLPIGIHNTGSQFHFFQLKFNRFCRINLVKGSIYIHFVVIYSKKITKDTDNNFCIFIISGTSMLTSKYVHVSIYKHIQNLLFTAQTNLVQFWTDL